MEKETKKSTYPKLSLSGSLKVIKEAGTIKGQISKETFAHFGARKTEKASVNSGAFTDKLAALKMYGLITATPESVALTDLAREISDPLSEEKQTQAVQKCFFNVAPFSALLEAIKVGSTMKKELLQEHAVTSLGIVREQRERFINNFEDAGILAGVLIKSENGSITRSFLTNDNQNKTDQPERTNPMIPTTKRTDDPILESKGFMTTINESWPKSGNNEKWSIDLSIKSNISNDHNFYNTMAEVFSSINKLSDLMKKYDEVDTAE